MFFVCDSILEKHKKRTCCNVEQPLSRAISGNIKDILLYIMIGSLTGGYDSGLACIPLTTPFFTNYLSVNLVSCVLPCSYHFPMP